MNGLTVAPDAAMPADDPAVASRTGMPPAPGNAASGEISGKPAATAGAIDAEAVQVLGARDALGRRDPGLGAGPAHAAGAAVVHPRRR